MFLQENEDLKDTVGMRKFAQFRPEDVIFQCDKASLKICLCRYDVFLDPLPHLSGTFNWDNQYIYLLFSFLSDIVTTPSES